MKSNIFVGPLLVINNSIVSTLISTGLGRVCFIKASHKLTVNFLQWKKILNILMGLPHKYWLLLTYLEERWTSSMM